MSNKMSNIESKRFEQIIKYLEVNGTISKSTAANILNVENKTAQRLLNKAEELSLLASEGENKGRIYKLNKNNYYCPLNAFAVCHQKRG